MKKFSFNLQTVLDYWLFQEERCHLELMRLVAEEKKLEATIQQVEGSLSETLSEFNRRAEVFPYEIQLFRNYIQHLEKSLAELNEKRHGLILRVERQRASLLEIRKKRKSLESLKERRKAQFDRTVAKLLQSEADERFLGQFLHKEPVSKD